MKRHGPDAPIQAAMRADAILDKGDLDGYAVFNRAVKAVEELRCARLANAATGTYLSELI